MYASKATGVSCKDIMGHARFQHISQARRLAMFWAHEAGVNYHEIGRAMDKDRTSVRYAVRKEKIHRQAR